MGIKKKEIHILRKYGHIHGRMVIIIGNRYSNLRSNPA